MKALMGHFGEANSEVVTPDQTMVIQKDGNVDVGLTKLMTEQLSPEQSSALFTTASNLAEKSLNMSLSRAAALAQSKEVQMFIKENGLEPYLRDVTQDRVKNILALFGLWQIYKIAKSPAFLIAAAGLGIYVLYGNKDKLVSKISSQVTAIP
jgi:hypothetical protein